MNCVLWRPHWQHMAIYRLHLGIMSISKQLYLIRVFESRCSISISPLCTFISLLHSHLFIHSLKEMCSETFIHSCIIQGYHHEIFKFLYICHVSCTYTSKFLRLMLWFLFYRYRTWKLLEVESWKMVSSDQNLSFWFVKQMWLPFLVNI